MVNDLDAPCRWCGYKGEHYWQEGTHGANCPWRGIDGADTRRLILDLHFEHAEGKEVQRALMKLAIHAAKSVPSHSV